MIKWLQDLMTEAEATVIDGVPEFGEVKEGETVVCELTDDLKKLYILLEKRQRNLHEEYRLLHRELGQGPGILLFEGEGLGLSEEAKAKMASCNVHHADVAVIDQIFWHCVCQTIPAHGDDQLVGLRQGWQVVTRKPEQRPKIKLASCRLGALLGL